MKTAKQFSLKNRTTYDSYKLAYLQILLLHRHVLGGGMSLYTLTIALASNGNDLAGFGSWCKSLSYYIVSYNRWLL